MPSEAIMIQNQINHLKRAKHYVTLVRDNFKKAAGKTGALLVPYFEGEIGRLDYLIKALQGGLKSAQESGAL